MGKPWTATFDEDGNVTLDPDTPETRVALNDTMLRIYGNRYAGIRVVPNDYHRHPNWDPGFEGTP